MTERTPTRTAKVDTEATTLKGALYVHVEHNEQGRATAVRFSSPGKMSDTTMERVLEALGQTTTHVLQELAAQFEPGGTKPCF
jgi:hypothetical protein